MISRRNLLKVAGLGAACAVGGVGTVFSLENTTDFQKTETTVFIPDLPKTFEGYRIGLIADIHFGLYFPTEWLEKVLSILNGSSLDLFLLGGDYVWIPDSYCNEKFGWARNKYFAKLSEDDLPQAIFSLLADQIAMVKAKDGIYAVLGNHDRWIAPDLCLKYFRAQNIGVLLNETINIRRGSDRLSLYGADDYWTGRPKVPEATERQRGREARLILAHNPDFMSEVLEKTQFDFDLGLAGHTHGGQVKLPLIGALRKNVRDERFFEGLCHHNRSQVYTTRGIGVVEFPYRINCPPEISILTLQSA